MDRQPSVDPAPSASAGPDDSQRRACDQCRMRKIRCDKEVPCANCRIAKRPCTSVGVGHRPKEPRQRVLISSQYEKKIDQIEIRLANIETLLKDLSNRSSNSYTPESNHRLYTPQPGHIPVSGSTIGGDSSDTESALGGDATFTAHTTFASEFLEHAVERTSLHDVNPKMREALANLRHLVELQNRQSISHGPRFPLQQPMPPGGLAQLRMPPMDIVVSLLKKIRTTPPGLFTFICYFVGVADFSGLCRMVYFPTDDFSDSTFIIVSAGLYYLFLEQQALAPDEATKQEYEAYLQACRVNLETALANMSLFMSAKVETVQALLFGTLYAIDVSRPSVAWHLNNAAAEICQTAGFHRQSACDSDPEAYRLKSGLFWYIYTTDRALALRLGRAPSIQDWDIDIPRSFHFDGIMSSETSGVALMWLNAAALQGRLYEQLYSPAALAKSQEELAERARVLAKQCREVEAEAKQTRHMALASLERMNVSYLVDIHVKGDEVQLLSTMTLVYRAIPAPEGSISRFCDECIEVARRAMHTHLACMELVRREVHAKAIYLHWNLLLTPFTPIFVIFCYIIETLSAEDLQLLQEFTKSLETSGDSSEVMGKLLRLCSVMTNVAMLYVEAKSQKQEDQTMIPIGDEFDMYLSQLGFIPTDEPAVVDPLDQANGMAAGSSQVAHMGDWFSGSRNLMGLLEQDISQIGGPQWS